MLNDLLKTSRTPKQQNGTVNNNSPELEANKQN